MQVKQVLNVQTIREDFPILNTKIKGKSLSYLDNAATSLTPNSVINAMNEFYTNYNANVHRAAHTLSQKSTEEYTKAHQKVADFINANFEEIIFTKSTTESLNLLAYSLTKNLEKGDEIILTEMEHHSNLVPWQQLAKEKGVVVKFMNVNREGYLEIDNLRELLSKKTKIVSLTHMSNVLGTINDIKKIAEIVHTKSAFLVVDAAQSVAHMKLDVKDLDCDFLAFSGHKMLGPTGIGVLYGKKHLLEKMSPFLFGGDMIKEVNFKDSNWNDLPWKFEAGTPNIAEAIGLSAAIDYLHDVGFYVMKEHEKSLTQYALKKLSETENVIVYGPQELEYRGPTISFNIKGVHSHDVSTILDSEGIAIRGGHMCAMPLVNKVLSANDICRVSLYFYNTIEEIDNLIYAINKTNRIFKQ